MTWTETKFLFSMAFAAAFIIPAYILLNRLDTWNISLWGLIRPGILGACGICCTLYGYRLLKQLRKDLLG